MAVTRPAVPPRNMVTTPVRTPIRTTRQQAAKVAASLGMTPPIISNPMPLIKTADNNKDTKNCDQTNKIDDICKYYYIHDKKLGEGGFAKVRLATHLATKQYVAIKCLDKIKLGPELPRIYNEIECLRRLKHQNIARLYQVFETTTVIYLVLEYCSGGELFDYIVKHKKLEEAESAQIIHDLMKTLDFIHVNGFAHRDLKPENVLLDDKHQIKLIDFGLAANCSAANLALNRNQAPLDQLSTCCGSVTYAAPEVISGENYSGTAVDVWSAGVMLYALLVGQLPFNDNNVQKIYQKIQAGLKTMPSFLSLEACDLIKRMLTIDPKKRITVRQVLSHPWLRNRANKFARINRRLDFNHGQLDEQIVAKCCEKFPKVDKTKLREYIHQDFNYYSTTYHLMHSKCPPRNFGVKRPSTDSCQQQQQMAQEPQAFCGQLTAPPAQSIKQTPVYHYSSPTKRSRFVTVTTTPRTPRTPPAYLQQLQQSINYHNSPVHYVNDCSVKKAVTGVEHTDVDMKQLDKQSAVTPAKSNTMASNKLDQQENANKMATFMYKPTPKRSIVKRLLDSVTPKKRNKKIKL